MDVASVYFTLSAIVMLALGFYALIAGLVLNKWLRLERRVKVAGFLVLAALNLLLAGVGVLAYASGHLPETDVLWRALCSVTAAMILSAQAAFFYATNTAERDTPPKVRGTPTFRRPK